MKKKLQDAVKEALKARNPLRASTVRSILAAIQYEEMEKGTDSLPEAALVKIIQKEAKTRREEIEFAKQAGRAETIETTEQELAIVESFLPPLLSESEIETFLVQTLETNPSATLGELMKVLKTTHEGQYDGRVASSVASRIVARAQA